MLANNRKLTMTLAKSNIKNGAEEGIDLLIECRKRGITVTELARRIRRARVTLYHAIERPSRYSATYKLIQEELAR